MFRCIITIIELVNKLKLAWRKVKMNQLKRIYKVCMLVLIFSLVSPAALPMSSATVAQAATLKLNKKELSLVVGKSYTLKVTGTKQKIIWTTSKKSVATVSKSGKIAAKKAGSVTITATVNKKKYTCKVTVKKAIIINPYISKAPFDAQESIYKEINYITPKDWIKDVIAEQGNYIVLSIHPVLLDATVGSSSIGLTIQETGQARPDYSLIKEQFEDYITEDLIISQLAQVGIIATLSDFKTCDYEAKLGTTFKTEYKVTHEGGTMTQVIYDLYIDNYLIEVTITDIGDNVAPSVSAVGEYLLNSIQIIK